MTKDSNKRPVPNNQDRPRPDTTEYHRRDRVPSNNEKKR